MFMIYGYARVSTPQQFISRQVTNIQRDFPAAQIFQEKWTGTTMDRQQWIKLKKKLKPGDTIVFDSVSRMSRNAEEGFREYQNLYRQGIHLVFLKEPYINTETYEKGIQNVNSISVNGPVDLILAGVREYLKIIQEDQIRIAFEQSEKEVMDLRQRTKEGMEEARRRGKQIGSKTGVSRGPYKTELVKERCDKIIMLNRSFNGSLNDSRTAEMLGISRKTLSRYKEKAKEIYWNTEEKTE